MKGWGPKSSVCPSKPKETKLFGGISRDFAGISLHRMPEKFEKRRVCVQFLAPSGGGDGGGRGVLFMSSSPTFRERKKHININKLAGLSRDWVGAKNLFMCFVFFGSFPMAEKDTQEKFSKNPGTIPCKFVYVFFFFMCFFP